jgi:hypothetical protein
VEVAEVRDGTPERHQAEPEGGEEEVEGR